ncbi:MAG: RNA polymerase sigma-54 factor, partial [Candidatus Krumholzibacteria bacterium]|nr:RNA polymerase sigma-54 factor [Candidatus Krumholzibacteria bacterium]
MKFGLHLRQRQTLVMTPKLQQALKLLQMPSIELQQMLKQEIMENPLLEEIEEYEEITEENEEKEASDGDGKDEPSESSQEEADSKPDGGEAGEEQVDWDEYFNAGFELGRAGGEEEQQEEFFEKVPVAKQSFTDQLMGQLRIATDEPATLMIGDYIIGSLDESGYLTCTIEEIAHTFDVNLEEVDRVLELIQSFDPPGVGARNLQECLLLQLRFRGEDDSLAAIIIRSHFDE